MKIVVSKQIVLVKPFPETDWLFPEVIKSLSSSLFFEFLNYRKIEFEMTQRLARAPSSPKQKKKVIAPQAC